MFNKNRALYHEGHHHHHESDHVHMECECGGGCGHVHIKEDQKIKDEKTLNILLVHWVNHNESHEEGFREWVTKAKDIRKEETAKYIEKAIEYMRQANDMLIEAKKHM